MRAMRLAVAVVVLLTATAARRGAQPGFAEPGDIIAAEGNFRHLSAAKGTKAAIRATATSDAQIFAPRLMRVSDYAGSAAVASFPAWHTGQVWMSCDGSVAVTHGAALATGWNITVWKRQKGGGYKWVLEEDGPLSAAISQSDPAESDMISASVADCPARRTHGAADAPVAPGNGKVPVADYTSGRADDGTLAWVTASGLDGSRIFTLQIVQGGALHDVLRATTPPPGS